MDVEDSPFFDFMATAITGSFIGQVGSRRGFDLDEMLDRDSPFTKSVAEDLADMGLSPRETTRHFLRCLVMTCLHENNVDPLLNMLAATLWQALGDPESGAPPPIYRKAAACMLVTFLKAVDPSLLAFVKDD